MSDDYTLPTLIEGPFVTLRQADDLICAAHTGCGNSSMFWYGRCTGCGIPTPKKFATAGDRGGEIHIGEPISEIKKWVAFWLEVDPARVEVSIK